MNTARVCLVMDGKKNEEGIGCEVFLSRKSPFFHNGTNP